MAVSFSIVTPVKEAARFIDPHWQCIIEQNSPVREVIYVDAGSADDTAERISKLTGATTKAIYVLDRDSSISRAFNRGIEEARSDFIVFLNCDDRIAPDHIQKLADIISRDEADIVTSGMNFVGPKKTFIVQPHFSPIMPPKKWFHPAINHPGMAIRKALLARTDGFYEAHKIAMDIDLFYRLVALSPVISVNSAVTVSQYDGGVSQRKWRLALSEMSQIEIAHGRSKPSAWAAYLYRSIKQTLKKSLKRYVG